MTSSKNSWSIWSHLVISCVLFQALFHDGLCDKALKYDPNPNPECGTSSVSSGLIRDYEIAARDQHNFYRNKHQSPPVGLDDQQNLAAQQCAEYYINKGTIDSSCPFKNASGENQYATWYRPSSLPSCSALANSGTTYWYNGIQDYDFRQPSYSFKTGSFTQVVWKTSKVIGVGCAARNGFAVLVTLYSPPGNRLSTGRDPYVHFRYNVLPPSRQSKDDKVREDQRSNFIYQSDSNE